MSTKIARIRIELEHIAPLIWRRVDVSLTTNLRALHEIIQAVMPWENYHLYQFAVGERVYGEPDPEDAVWGRKIYQAKGMRLGTLVDRGVTELLYTYDFGDDWQHRVILEEVIEATAGTDYPLLSMASAQPHLKMWVVLPGSWTSLKPWRKHAIRSAKIWCAGMVAPSTLWISARSRSPKASARSR